MNDEYVSRVYECNEIICQIRNSYKRKNFAWIKGKLIVVSSLIACYVNLNLHKTLWHSLQLTTSAQKS